MTALDLEAARALTLRRDVHGFADAIDRSGSVLLHLAPGTEVNACNAQNFVDFHNALLAALATARADVARLKALFNDDEWKCEPSCDSYGHAENCAYVSPAEAYARMRDQLAAARAERDAMREALARIADGWCRSTDATCPDMMVPADEWCDHCIAAAALIDRMTVDHD